METSTILNEVAVDDELKLQLLAGEKTPWIVLLNDKARKRRNVRLNWFETARPIHLGGGKEYDQAEVDKALAELMAAFFSSVSVQALFWQAFRFLQKGLHQTAVIVDRSDCSLLPESKRDYLWLAYVPHQSPHGLVRHTFPLGETERPLVERFLSGDTPWPALELTAQEARKSMAAFPFVRDLAQADPVRWLRPLMLAVAGVLLGFQDGSAGLDCDFSDSIWQAYYGMGRLDPEKAHFFGLDVFLGEMRGLVRLWPYLGSVRYERAFDGLLHLQERGFSRRERFNALIDASGRRQFVVTRLTGDEGALLLSPLRPGPGEKDRILFFPQALYNEISSLNKTIGILDNDFASLQLWRSWRRYRGQKRLDDLFGQVPLFRGMAPTAAGSSGKEE
ncbi:MAG: hypothetical protein JMJ93_08010 [Synergistaceae bacterium]|nr:hypothetical protein [Synergistaceae bacterium]